VTNVLIGIIFYKVLSKLLKGKVNLVGPHQPILPVSSHSTTKACDSLVTK